LAAAHATSVPFPVEAIGKGIAQAKSAAKQESVPKPSAEAIKQDIVQAKALQEKAAGITKSIGELASSGKLPTTDESIALLKILVTELQDVNEQLKKIDERLKDVESWIEDQSMENIPIMQNDIATLKKPGIGNYIQFQWVDTQEGSGTTNDGFQMRRMRYGQNNRLDSKTSMKVSFDLSTGSQRIGAEMRDAQLIYEPVPSISQVGVRLVAGQQPLPLGFELERSSGEREFPERTLYNNAIFAGERDRGLRLDYGLSPASHAHVGIWNGLTVGDRQLVAANTFRNLNGQYGFHGGVRHYSNVYDVGISGFFAKRPAGSNGTPPNNAYPAVDRQFIYVDGTYLLEQVALRAELMFGRDRIPTLGSDGRPIYLAATSVLGYQAQVTYNHDSRNQIHFRYQYFDPDRGMPSNGTTGYGIGYTYWINPSAKITGTYEIFDEEGPELKNNVFTIRYQFRL
jgi:hypothetical protein